MYSAARIFQKIKSWRAFSAAFLRNTSPSKPLFGTNERFYPEQIQRHRNEPTKLQFAMISDPKFGEGIVSKIPFHRGELIFRFDGQLRDTQTLFTLQKKPGVYIEDPYFMGKILHCCDPNASVDMENQLFWARKDIQPGELITMDYESTEDELFRSFHCQCGAPTCRGRIAGKAAKSTP
ncbi:SET domain-containing protein [Paenibacillus cremeus]|uniref:SET domain-containing protein n=1 Tax=Paenibacillus cremeus TaxID=2163881 RepID=A0A559KDR8_9BACL|nr:SET domain-containing protein [Paenibacillus cremeus]TVY10277.1 SET domain-containing protein [Paenibacillus cremeus]